MSAIRLAVFLGAVLLTTGELLSVDYYTAWLASSHTGHITVATLVARQ